MKQFFLFPFWIISSHLFISFSVLFILVSGYYALLFLNSDITIVVCSSLF